ncbi:MAG: DNA polymerase III subunit delta [Myxococcales bacterium]|nr:DNA polymerase III subunit delta [Myxococcota bacterium]MDW8280492.1 DNA polymerase III subunit delta [Myxococcales bacterium]
MPSQREPRDVRPEDPLLQLETALRAGAPPLIYLYGSEQYLVARAAQRLQEAVLEPATRAFNYDVFDAREAQPVQVLAAARTLPMMARRRLVVLREADALDPDRLAAYTDYALRPAPETCLCFVAEKADLRLKFFSVLRRHGLLLRFDPLSERQLPGFVRAEAQRLHLRLEAGVAERIAQEVGGDLGQLVDALERLAAYVAEDAPVRMADVEEVVATTRQHTVFELVDALGAGNRAAALRLLAGALQAREPALRLLALIARHVRQLWIARELSSRGPTEVAQALGVPPFVASKLLEQGRRLTPAQVGAMHDAIFETDRMLKLSRLEDERHMEHLVLRLCDG